MLRGPAVRVDTNEFKKLRKQSILVSKKRVSQSLINQVLIKSNLLKEGSTKTKQGSCCFCSESSHQKVTALMKFKTHYTKSLYNRGEEQFPN